MCERCWEIAKKTIGEMSNAAKANVINASIRQMHLGLHTFQVGLNAIGIAGADTKTLDQISAELTVTLSLHTPDFEATAAKLRAEPEIVLGFDKMDWASKPSSN